MNLLTKLSLFTFSTFFQLSFGYLSSHLLFIFITYFYLVTEVKCRCLIICWSEYKYWLCGHNPNDDCRVLKRPGGVSTNQGPVLVTADQSQAGNYDVRGSEAGAGAGAGESQLSWQGAGVRMLFLGRQFPNVFK